MNNLKNVSPSFTMPILDQESIDDLLAWRVNAHKRERIENAKRKVDDFIGAALPESGIHIHHYQTARMLGLKHRYRGGRHRCPDCGWLKWPK